MYSIIISFIVFYVLTGEIKAAGQFTFLIETVKLFQYFIFEKIWLAKKNKLFFLKRKLNKFRKVINKENL
ncbi:MAG: DUF2061 domain-containing protein [Candidatus Andersenbacteria bacterium]|nr:DUF2061 domain-containing protein [Candidatus Andersenbacteria bacterium]